MKRRSPDSHGLRRLRYPTLVALALGLVLLGGCSNEPEPPTAAELLAELEGRELTAVELAEQEEVFSFLCTLDDDVLLSVWSQLDEPQLERQDIAFGVVCPQRNALYAEATGRFATAE